MYLAVSPAGPEVAGLRRMLPSLPLRENMECTLETSSRPKMFGTGMPESWCCRRLCGASGAGAFGFGSRMEASEGRRVDEDESRRQTCLKLLPMAAEARESELECWW